MSSSLALSVKKRFSEAYSTASCVVSADCFLNLDLTLCATLRQMYWQMFKLYQISIFSATEASSFRFVKTESNIPRLSSSISHPMREQTRCCHDLDVLDLCEQAQYAGTAPVCENSFSEFRNAARDRD